MLLGSFCRNGHAIYGLAQPRNPAGCRIAMNDALRSNFINDRNGLLERCMRCRCFPSLDRLTDLPDVCLHEGLEVCISSPSNRILSHAFDGRLMIGQGHSS